MPVICIISRVPTENGVLLKQAVIEVQSKWKNYGGNTTKRELDVFIPDGEKLKFISLFEVSKENLGILHEDFTN